MVDRDSLKMTLWTGQDASHVAVCIHGEGDIERRFCLLGPCTKHEELRARISKYCKSAANTLDRRRKRDGQLLKRYLSVETAQ